PAVPGDAGPADSGEQPTADAEGADQGPPACTPRRERCNGQDDDCDGLTDEDFLLARDVENCGRCGNRCHFANAAAACRAGECRLDRCVPGYVDRDGRPENGCEEICRRSNGGIEICDGADNDCNGVVDDGYDLQEDAEHCGACGRACMLRHAEAGCTLGRCVIASCEPGFHDEDGEPLTGCEATCRRSNGGVEACDGEDNDCDGLTDEDFDLQGNLRHCGRCDHVCRFDHAVPRCLDGRCVIQRCEEGWSDQGDPADGCETPCVVSNGGTEICDGRDNDCNGVVDDGFDLSQDVDNCGQCGRECRVANGEAGCGEGDCLIVACEPGFIDADRRYANGCETSCVPDEDPFEACDGRDNDCNGLVDEIWDLTSDPFHCGSCGRVCAFANAVGGCVRGECVIAACEAGYADVDRRPENGCEAACEVSAGGVEICDELDNDCNGVVDDGFDLLGDAQNCGRCNRVCPGVAHGVRGCLGGECAIARCEAGWHDADRLLENGCEYRCDPSPDMVERCDQLDNDCDGTVDEGFDKRHGLEHCGRCFQECRPAHAVPVCDEGVCRIAQCEPGWNDVANGVADGCELACVISNGGLEICDEVDNDCNGVVDDGYDKQNDPTSCGGCGVSCLRPHRVVPCVRGRCALGECTPGWVDENGLPEDGCEYACNLTGEERCDGLDNDC
ncbi:MAG: hypothetical protein FJ125_13400, partial [Deltaproteobacteria bacterium]|nr:hypothetical protein [Deltaproteobacteria bacterium]